jgi:septal ring factor EnvC (AmiA/AmiB activator)
MEYSMDHSVYFQTLAQYQYNPALIISASQGTEVLSSAAGTVTDVGTVNEYGNYVTVDLGDGYELTYGQLGEVSLEVGETVAAGENIGIVASPSRSYVQEGDNLYLKLTKDGAPVDPGAYLTEE